MLKNKSILEIVKICFFYLSLFILIFALGAKYNFLDHDLFSRLIQGSNVINFGHVFYNDPVSYTPTHIWYDPEWITSGFLYLISQNFGAEGFIVLKCLSSFLIIFFISLAIKERLKTSKETPYNILFYIFILSVFTLVCILSYTIRCQNITFILLPVWILILEKIRKGDDKWLYSLPFIMLLWLNCHGGSISGVGILILYGIGEALNKRPFKKYFIALIFVCLVYFINPWGADFIKFIFESSYLDRSWIKEWQPTFKNLGDLNNYSTYFVFLFLTVITYISTIILKKINYSKLDKTKLLILLVTIYLSISARKHVELFIVIASIFIYENFYFIYNTITSKLQNALKIDNNSIEPFKVIKNTIIYTAIYIYSFIILFTNPFSFIHNNDIRANYPINAVEFIKINNLKGKIIAQFHYSTYIAWKLYPDIKIYMDGRQEQVYDKKIFDELMYFYLHLGDNPHKIVEEYSPDYILTDFNWGDNDFYRESKDYKEIYNDGGFCLFAKAKIAKNEYKPVMRDDIELISEMFYSNF